MTPPRPSEDDRPVIVLGPNPTPNGGMHLGHIAGPYLAGDVYARYQRSRGRDVVFSTGTDDSQTFVTTTARRRGIDPEELCRTSTAEIREALTAIGISVDGFGPFDETYRETVLDYFRRLHAAGTFRLKTVRLPYRESTGEFLVEGLVEGDCPVCLTTCRGGLCETCNHPNNFDQLLDPHYTLDPAEQPTYREATILVLPLEEHRDRLTAYHQAWLPYWRPHLAQMIREVLARPLPDVPITYPLAWGMAAPFPETPGQVLNAWLELIPAGMYTTSYVAGQRTGQQLPPGALWRVEENRRMVHFLGFDNAFFFCFPHLAMLMAQGDGYLRPEWIINNEFYELESEKFSTSKGHVVTCQEILREVPRDVVRLYLALTAPEHQRTTFSRDGLDKVAQRLVGSWNRLAAALGKAVANAASGAAAWLPVSTAARTRAATMLDRFGIFYEMPSYSLTRAADTILVHIDRLANRAAALDGLDIDVESEAFGDLFIEVKALLAGAAPILIDLAATVAANPDSEFEADLSGGAGSWLAFDSPAVKPFTPPLLATTPGR